MKKALLLLPILAVGLVYGQLNYEGNPLTENTEYTAEESQFSQRTARRENTVATKPGNPVTGRPQKLYLVSEDNEKGIGESSSTTNDRTIDTDEQLEESVTTENAEIPRANSNVESARHFTKEPYGATTNSVNPAEVALSTFLNSKTPEESRLSLEHYLQSRVGITDQNEAVRQPQQQPVSLSNQQQRLAHQETLLQAVQPNQQRTFPTSSAVNQQLTSQLVQQQQHQMLQAYPVVNQGQQLLQSNGQVYNQGLTNTQTFQSMPNLSTTTGLTSQQQVLQQVPYMPSVSTGIQARNDFFYPMAWHPRVRRIRGKPYSPAQPKLGPGLHKGPVPVPFKQKGPVEVIYTRPPGFHRGSPYASNPPVVYEDASAWFPDANYPPPTKDIYYSQLYAQSYDPHYYNYIAKTGKIKPHLYGKLGKPHKDEEGGIWSELYQGFKKHGLKNMMTPTFLLGMTLPVVTLMLTALVQKRSLARSDSREFGREDPIQEYLERMQRAMECYEKKRKKNENGTSVDEC